MYTKYISEILQELQECLSSGSTAEFAMIGQLIDQAEKIFVAGMGRTGYVMKGFTMRLEQAGYEAYWIGDTNTPAAGKGDLLILGSGSGETETLKVYAKKAKELQIPIIVFTTCRESSLHADAAVAVVINADAKFKEDTEKKSVQPMGSLFEEALFISRDSRAASASGWTIPPSWVPNCSAAQWPHWLRVLGLWWSFLLTQPSP